MKERVCKKCGEKKNIDQFRACVGKLRKDGKRSPPLIKWTCRTCESAKLRQWRKENKEHCDQKRKEWIEKNPEKWAVIVINHRNKPETKEKQRRVNREWRAVNRPKKSKKAKPAKIRVCFCGEQLPKFKRLCPDCRNQIKTQRINHDRQRYNKNKETILTKSKAFKYDQRKTLDDQYILKKLKDQYGIPRTFSIKHPEIIELKRKQITLKRLSNYEKTSNANG